MPRTPRKFLFDPAEVGVYHCVNRCVRRAFLCGTDAQTGKCYEHRKGALQSRLEHLAGQFAVDVLGFAIMSNHIHLVARNRPDIVAGWSDAEVARRWWNIFPKRKNDDGTPAVPTDFELQMITAVPDRLVEIRRRLSSISWFMRCLVEPIARLANKEDACSGRFWQGRFFCQKILDDAALLACLAYVDLNLVRAGIAPTPEASQYTSVYERVQALKPPGTVAEPQAVPDVPENSVIPDRVDGTAQPADNEAKVNAAKTGSRAEWLSPFELSEAATADPVPAARASNKGCLSMPFAEYLQMLDWTGRTWRSDKRCAIPDGLAPILERLALTDESWMNLVRDFRRKFRRAAGTPDAMQKEAEKHGYRKMYGMGHSREIFDKPPQSSA
jgi:REP element-mobilizing transposase RayT